MDNVQSARQQVTVARNRLDTLQADCLTSTSFARLVNCQSDLARANADLEAARATLAAAEKAARLMGTSALESTLFQAGSYRIDRASGTGIDYGNSLRLATSAERVEEAAAFGLGALNGLNRALDSANVCPDATVAGFRSYADGLTRGLPHYTPSDFSPAAPRSNPGRVLPQRTATVITTTTTRSSVPQPGDNTSYQVSSSSQTSSARGWGALVAK